MTEQETPWWAQFFAEHSGEGYNMSYWNVQNTLGRRPAVLVIDVVRSFTGDEGQSLAQAQADYPTSCGPNAWVAMPAIKSVIDLAQAHGWPIAYTTGMPGGAPIFGGTVKTENGPHGSAMDLPRAQEIPDAIKPPPDAHVYAKPKASAFFDTALNSFLIRRGVDSIIVAGATTSGCVRATVIDAHSTGYPTFVVDEAVFDRSTLSAAVNLFEMNAKYADVITLAQLTEMADERS
jgi:nicotinamidase-related amidase